MRAAFEQIGVKMLSDDTCARLLAMVYCYGDEASVYSEVMRRDIQDAQKRAGILPGCKPDARMVRKIALYASQIWQGRAGWLETLGERYGVRFEPLTDWRADAREHWEEYVHGGVCVSESQHE